MQKLFSSPKKGLNFKVWCCHLLDLTNIYNISSFIRAVCVCVESIAPNCKKESPKILPRRPNTKPRTNNSINFIMPNFTLGRVKIEI